jgi:hypothetical protein
MDRKQRLSVDALRVETFDAGGPSAALNGLRAQSPRSLDTLCDTDYDSLCPCCSIDAGCGAA